MIPKLIVRNHDAAVPHIICIHGLSGSTAPFEPLIDKLYNAGFTAHLFDYDSRKLTINESAALLDKFIADLQAPVILIGHSAGGRIALQAQHASIIGIITIATPVGGSLFAKIAKIVNSCPMLEDLARPHTGPINRPLVTITTELFCNFDGRIFTSEMNTPDAVLNIHITGSRHSGAQNADPRIHNAIFKSINLIKDYTFNH